MRRLTLAALASVVVLSACSDQAKQSPTEPSAVPEQNLVSCRPVKFPLVAATGLIKQVFPVRLRVEALARAAAVALLWDACKVDLARKAAASFVDWMNGKSSSLTGSLDQRNALVSLLFTGVGLTPPSGTTLGPDFGIGTVDPKATTPTLIETGGNTGLIEFQPASIGHPAAFPELTVVTITRKPDGFRLDGFPPEDQFPPFFDYTASNASNTHKIADGAVARMAFCLLGATSFPDGYPDAARIGHNPDPTLQPPVFEIIPADPGVGDYTDDLVCGNLQTSLGSFGGGLLGFGRSAGRFFAPLVRTLFLPQPLMATTVGTRGPLGGLPPSLSPHGVVNATSYFGFENAEPTWSNAPAESFWNLRASTAVNNAAYPTYVGAPGVADGAVGAPLILPVPQPLRKDRSAWFGQVATGNYLGTRANEAPGGTSTQANSGSFTSPQLLVPNVSDVVELRFNTWWEIEGVNPGRHRTNPPAENESPSGPYDVMDVSIVPAQGEPVLVAQLNPEFDPTGADRARKPYTSGGFDAPPVWQPMAIDVSAFKGQTVRIQFDFTTRDVQYNGFRGWLVDDVRISSRAGSPVILQSIGRSGTSLIPGKDLPATTR
jgi:hypothetical protein